MTFWTHSAGKNIAEVAFADTTDLDAFGRIRISPPFTLFDSKQIWNDSDIADNAENFPLFYDNQETSGGGTSTSFDLNRASTTLSVSADTAGVRVRQTKQRFNYQPGKSMLVILTGKAGNTGAGIIKELGYYDDDNGVFYRDTAGVWSVVIRSFVSGVAVENEVTQPNWNIDRMDGTGPSGITLNHTATQIIFFDFEWLGTGRVRFGFFVDGVPFYVHEFLNANNLTSVYMSTPNLPIRCRIENDGSGGADSVEQICATVISEGGIQPNGILRWSDIGAAAADRIAAGTINTTYAICGIRLKANYLSADVRLLKISIVENSAANNPFLWKLHLNPTLTTGLTYSDVPNSAIQFGTGSTAGDVISGNGTIVNGGYRARTDANTTETIEAALRLGSLINGTRDELVLSATPTTTNQFYFGGLQWREAW